MLEAVGLGADEEAVYRLVLGRPAIELTDLSSDLDLPEPAVLGALALLLDAGLIIKIRDGVYAAAPPAVALGALITQQRDALRTAELALARFAEEHRAAAADRSIGEQIEVVTGIDAIRHRFLQVQHAAREQVRTFVTGPFVAVSPGDNPAETAVVERGVRFRALVERALLEEPGAAEETVASLRSGVEVRVADTLPMKLMLADSHLGLVPLNADPHGEPGAVLLHRSGLLAAMEALFEAAWLRAFPLEVSTVDGEDVVEELEPDGPAELDRRILALLLAGLTDQAVAGQLNLSVRTLQRRLRRLMDIAGAGTRMQLGWHAARNRWT
jgi:sugar-specific transcriptional regulator TrmB